VPGLKDVVSVGEGAEHACALDAGGQVWCWGSNTCEQVTQLPRGVELDGVAVVGL